MFLSPGYRKPDIVVSKAFTETSSLPQYFEHTEDGMIVKTAELLRKRVLDTISTSSDMSWPPDVDSLKNRKPPEILEAFYRNLLGFNKQTEKSVRIVNSLCSDGHSISYDIVCRIENDQAELAQQQRKSSTILPLQPINQNVQVSLIKTTFSFSVFSIRPTIIYICMCKAQNHCKSLPSKSLSNYIVLKKYSRDLLRSLFKCFAYHRTSELSLRPNRSITPLEINIRRS